jgi:hypothetical protein
LPSFFLKFYSKETNYFSILEKQMTIIRKR